MKNLLGFNDQELLADYINEYGKLKMLLAELRADVQTQEDMDLNKKRFDWLHFERRLIVLKLEEDFGIELNELAEAKEHINVVTHLKSLRD